MKLGSLKSDGPGYLNYTSTTFSEIKKLHQVFSMLNRIINTKLNCCVVRNQLQFFLSRQTKVRQFEQLFLLFFLGMGTICEGHWK